MEDFNNMNRRQHNITLSNRRTCSISGVTDAISFDLNEILLETDQGMLMIRGSEMHVSRLLLEKGEIEIEGMVNSLTYSENNSLAQKGESFLTKLFK